jgi:hypothetical protein
VCPLGCRHRTLDGHSTARKSSPWQLSSPPLGTEHGGVPAHHITVPQRQFGCRIPPSGTCTLPELKQGRVQIQFQIPMMGMLFGKSADASPTNVEQCSSRPVWSLSLCRRKPEVPGHINSYGCCLLISAKACSHVACTSSLTRTVFACTDDSNNADSIFAVPSLSS